MDVGKQLEALREEIAELAKAIAKRDLGKELRQVRRKQRELHDPDCPFGEEP